MSKYRYNISHTLCDNQNMYYLDAISGKHKREHLDLFFKNTKKHHRARFLYSQEKINDEIMDTFDPSQKTDFFSPKYLKLLFSKTKTSKIISIIYNGITLYLKNRDNERLRSHGSIIYNKINELAKHLEKEHGIQGQEKIFLIITNLYNHVYWLNQKKNSHHKNVFIIQPKTTFLEDEKCKKITQELIDICKNTEKRGINIDHFFAGFGAYFFQKNTKKIDRKLEIVLFLSKIF